MENVLKTCFLITMWNAVIVFFFSFLMTTYFLDITNLRLWQPSSIHSCVGLCVHKHTIETKGIYCEQECQGIISLYLNLPLGYRYYNHIEKGNTIFLPPQEDSYLYYSSPLTYLQIMI